MFDWLVRLLNAVSQLLNVTLLNGDPNESISGRSYREGWDTARKIIDTLFWFDPQHCLTAHVNERVWARKVLDITPDDDDV